MTEQNNNHEGGRRDGYTPSHHNNNGSRFPRERFGQNNNGEGGYRPRQNYEGQRSRFQKQGRGYADGEGGYQPRQQGGYRQQRNYGEGGYQPRQQGGYQPRQQGGYRSEGGYQPRQQGGYRQQRGYGEGSYQPRQQGGYAPRQNDYESRSEGGYQPRQQGSGGYGSNYRGGGYGQHAPRKTFNKKKLNPGKKRIDYSEEAYDPMQPIRLNKFLANAGVCSRRDADKYIAAGVVTVNGEVITELGHKVLRTDTVLFHDQQIRAERKVYVLLNKPKGFVTTSEDPQNRKTVMDLVARACRERIYPVGRLDRNTTGVLLLTNDGEMASKLTHPKFLKKKIYHVHLDRNVSVADLRQIAEGITLEDGEIRADAIDYASDTDKKQVGIEIHSGKNRIVRRIFESLGYHVVKLDRVYFAGLTKKNVKRGDWRFLTEEEVSMLRMGAFE